MKLWQALAFGFFAASLGAGAAAASANASLQDLVHTDAGWISGLQLGANGEQVHLYRGIPYAAPPVGALRWKPPQLATPWKGVRKATAYGPIAEDCLYLNVTTVARSANAKLPVMVWLHGGGLDSSNANSPLENDPALARHGVVLVTVNHRLGAFGLFAHPALTAESADNASGNYGMLDLVAALGWVQRNIAQFGGDPQRVTIFGQDVGAQSVIWLLASPRARGLFQRAIVESGTSRQLADNNTRIDTEAEAYVASKAFTDRAGTDDLAALRAMPWQRIVAAMPAGDYRMHPAIDAWSLTDHPINIIDEDIGNDVPVLIGADAGEEGVFVGYAEDWLPAFASANSNVYVYRFTHLPVNMRRAGTLSPHGLEVHYHFGHLDGESGIDAEDRQVAEYMMKIWTAFASHGDPSVEGLVRWPPFKATPGLDRYVTLGTQPEVHDGFIETFKSRGP
jgi:para-nitrobenzyl esterase